MQDDVDQLEEAYDEARQLIDQLNENVFKFNRFKHMSNELIILLVESVRSQSISIEQTAGS